MPFCTDCGKQLDNNSPCICMASKASDTPVPDQINQKRLPGQRMIKVVGIITTVFAVLEFFDIVNVFGLYQMPNVSFGGVFSAIVMMLILGMGISGIVFATDKSKGLIVLIFGIAILALMITIEFIGAGNYALSMFAPLGILYIIGGAIRLKGTPTK